MEKERILELLDELKQECIARKVPMFATIALESEDEDNPGTQYETNIVTPMYLNKKLSDDKITPMSAFMSSKFKMEFIHETTQQDIDNKFFEEMENEF